MLRTLVNKQSIQSVININNHDKQAIYSMFEDANIDVQSLEAKNFIFDKQDFEQFCKIINQNSDIDEHFQLQMSYMLEVMDIYDRENLTSIVIFNGDENEMYATSLECLRGEMN